VTARAGGRLALATLLVLLALVCLGHEYWRATNAGRSSAGLAVLATLHRGLVFSVAMLLWHRLLRGLLPMFWPPQPWPTLALFMLAGAVGLFPVALDRSTALLTAWQWTQDEVGLRAYVYLGLYRSVFDAWLIAGAGAIAGAHCLCRSFQRDGALRDRVAQQIRRSLESAPDGWWYHERRRIHAYIFRAATPDSLYEAQLREMVRRNADALSELHLLAHTPSSLRTSIDTATWPHRRPPDRGHGAAFNLALHENHAEGLVDEEAGSPDAHRAVSGALVYYTLAAVTGESRFIDRLLETCQRLRTPGARSWPDRNKWRQRLYARTCAAWAWLPSWAKALLGYAGNAAPAAPRRALEVGRVLDLITQPPADCADLLPDVGTGLAGTPISVALCWLAISRWLDQAVPPRASADVRAWLRLMDGYYTLCQDEAAGPHLEGVVTAAGGSIDDVRRLQALCRYRVAMAWFVYAQTLRQAVGDSDHAAICLRRAIDLCEQAGASDAAAHLRTRISAPQELYEHAI
jgi:hypothetical protein